MNALIVEDETLSARRLRTLLGEIDPSITVERLLDSVESAIAWLTKNPQPSLLFLDIRLSDGLSFEIFKRVDVRCPVIFTTAHDEYALQAFKVNSVDYLLKPVDKEELRRSLRKLEELRHRDVGGPNGAIENLLRSMEAMSKQYKSRFLVKAGQTLITVFDKDVAYFVSDRKLTFLVARDGRKLAMDEPLDELESELRPHEFFRLNRQCIAGVSSIASVHTFFNGRLKIDLKPPAGHEVIVSRDRVRAFKAWLNE
jgi:two-component system LytT family response regulator